MSDRQLEELEAELRKSQFTEWDAESVLAARHQAKIKALEERETRLQKGWVLLNNAWLALRHIGVVAFAYLGFMIAVTMLGFWLLTGTPFPFTPDPLP